MQGNGRLTAPPQLEAVLVTNSVDFIVSQAASNGTVARGTTLETSSPGISLQSRNLRTAGSWTFDPVSAAQHLSPAQEAAVRN
jgi:hypothetical protein